MSTEVSFLELDNPVKDYSWGHESYLPEFLGRRPANGSHFAEVWMGAHPQGPSIIGSGPWAGRNLAELIELEPAAMLGPTLTAAGIRELPFLLKVLAAGQPLSIQAHPAQSVAETGFNIEEAAGIPRSDSRRNYRDRNHKPETICALTELWGLCGFRPATAISRDFNQIAAAGGSGSEWFAARAILPADIDRGQASWCRLLTEQVLGLGSARQAVVGCLLRAAAGRTEPRWRFLRAAAVQNPDDPGLLFFLILDLHHLRPGEALSIPAGTLHAYLQGAGVEVMANSDNVLRGGLTPKHVDAGELLRNLDPAAQGWRHDSGDDGTTTVFPEISSEFRLSRTRSLHPCTVPLGPSVMPRIALCTEGTVRLAAAGGQEHTLVRGASVYVMPDGKPLEAMVEGELFLAEVPHD